ncbi:Ovarian cancer-associated protein 2 [Coemansia asiatica]|nr:Ovarian cancer-associated protein 2 [Coemansia asiatica]
MQSLDVVKNVLEKEGPFDGVLGFSQGAGMAAIVAALAESGEMRGFRFAMFFAGFYPDQLRLFGDLVKERRLRVPSLHVVGESDAVVPCVRGVDLAARAFENAQVLRHAGGHFVPCNAEWRKIYQAFLATINLE